MLLFWSQKFVLPLPAGHHFPMIKYELVRKQLLDKLIVKESNFVEPVKITIETLSLVHSSHYLNRMFSGELTETEIRRIGFPYSKSMIERELLICGAMIEASKSALQSGISFNMAGGTHHAFADFGSAYCIFNDMAIATHYLLTQNLVCKVMIVDLDVHQGNGTASIFSNDNNVFVFNVYGKNVFPLRKQKSDLDVELPDGVTDKQYIDILTNKLSEAISHFKPDIVLYQAGVDLLRCDKLGKFAMTLEGLKQRDKLVFQTFLKRNIPVAVCIGGGYSPDIQLIVEAHCNTIISAKDAIKTYRLNNS